MKPSVLFSITLQMIVFCSCSSGIESSLSISDCPSEASHPLKISFSEAKTVAINSYRDFFQNDMARSQSFQDLSLGDCFCVTSTSGADTLMYVINYADSMGFALISPIRSEEPIAIVEKGYYNPSNKADNAEFDYYIQQIKEICSEKTTQNRFALSRAPISSGIGDIVGEITSGPYCSVSWGQSGIYGACCPNGIAGCSNTALAQVLSVFEYPQVIDLTFDNSGQMELRWADIKKHIKGNDCDIHSNNIHDVIAKLMRELGYRSMSNYKDSSTGTYPSYSAYVLEQLGYNVKSSEYSDDFVVKSIPFESGDGLGVDIIVGYDNDNDHVGHMWLIDGYKIITKRYTSQLVNPGLGPGVDSNPTYKTFHYNHFNWGWDGDYNGYYISGDYQVGKYNLNNDVFLYSVSL